MNIRSAWIFVVMVCCCSGLQAQQLPMIKANNKLADILDGDQFYKGYWTISPQIKTDIYTTSFSRKNKTVTFYTDIDSIRLTIQPGAFVKFGIILNGRDTAITAIYSYDTLAQLKKAAAYNTREKTSLPAFTYQSSEEPHLKELRRSFNLDSIAGEGNDVSRILNLMHWIHNLIPHDGNHDNPVVKNALSMIAVCKKENRGLNCRGLATVLNECYLSMGYCSRYVTCLPKDSLGIDNDCHVIDMVYCNSLRKWLWIDPTFDAYVMDETGNLLSIEEVRERIINNKPLILNPEANWNHKISEDKTYYLYSYMAKNLYLLECPLNSCYDLETRQSGKVIPYVQLIPLTYFNHSLELVQNTNPQNNTTFITYKTHNPKYFWQAPADKAVVTGTK